MLIGNYSVLNKTPSRWLAGGSTAGTSQGQTRANFNANGARRGVHYPDGATAALKSVGYPTGGYQSVAWMFPYLPKEMVSLNLTELAISGTATGGKGLPGTGSATLTITTNTPAGELIVSGAGTISFSISTNNPLLTASINGGGSASFLIDTNTPILGAEASLIGTTSLTISTNTPVIFPIDDTPPARTATASFAFTGSLVRYGLGIMEGTTDISDVVTNASVARAVWDELLAEHPDAGSAGLALATASSGGVDYTALGNAVWASVSRTLTSGGTAPTTAEIVAAIEAAVVPVNTIKMNSVSVIGSGISADKWRGVDEPA